MTLSKIAKRHSRHRKIRKSISGTEQRPRLIAYRSLKNNYAALIDDTKGHTLCQANDLKMKEKKTKVEKAKLVGLEIAKKALEHSITACVFDRNGYKYHGRVKALAEGAREGGLKF